MSLSMVQGMALPAKANVLAQQGRKRGLKASSKAVVCRAAAQPNGDRESKAMLASAALAGAMLVMQVPACHASYAYPELFSNTVVSEPEPSVVEAITAPVAEVLSKALPAPPVEAGTPSPGGSEGVNPAVLGGAAVAILAGLGAYASNLPKQEEEAAAAPPAEPEEFDPAVAEARASEASMWIARWRSDQEIRARSAEASDWIARWRQAAEQREREERVAERTQWIANWRAVQAGEPEASAADASVPWLNKVVKNVMSAFAS